MKLHTAINRYLNWKASYTNKAGAEYKRTLDRLYAFTQKDLELLELDDLGRFRIFLRERYRLSDNSLSQAMIVIKNFIRFWKEQGVGQITPSQIRINKNFVVKSHIPVNSGDFRLMCNTLNPNNLFELQKLCVIHLLFYTGVRVSELCEIGVAQLGKGKAFIKNKKNNNSRWIYWPAQTQNLLQKFVELRIKINHYPYVFFGNSQNAKSRLSTRSVQRWISEICKNAKINKRLTPHSFRHGKAIFIRDRGADIHDIANILGHKSLESSRVYLKHGSRVAEKRAKKFLE